MDTGVGIAIDPSSDSDESDESDSSDNWHTDDAVEELWVASRDKDIHRVMHVLKLGGINRKNIDQQFSVAGTTALWEAVICRDWRQDRQISAEIARILISNGANPLKYGGYGYGTYPGEMSTPLHQMILSCPRTSAMSNTLEDSPNLNVNVRDGQGRTPLLLGVECDVQSLSHEIRTLLRHGADPSIPDLKGDTILHLCRCVFISNIVLCGSIPVDINARNDRGETALHRAVIDGVYEMVYLLLQMGVDYNITDCNGETAEGVELRMSSRPTMISRALEEQNLAIAMASHPRLGAGSRLGTIEPGLLKTIAEMSRMRHGPRS
jgi:hypothetical protein